MSSYGQDTGLSPTKPRLKDTCPTKRNRRLMVASARSADFFPTDKPLITDISKGRRPVATPPPPQTGRRSKKGLCEACVADRPTVNKIVDKIVSSGQQSYVRKILRSYDSSNAGFLSKDKLRVAIDRLAIGLTDTEKGKVVARLDPDNSNRIPVDGLTSTFGEGSFEKDNLSTTTNPPFYSHKRSMTPSGMSKRLGAKAGDRPSTTSNGRRTEEVDDMRDVPVLQPGVPLKTQMDISQEDVDAALQSPKTYALQQQLYTTGRVKGIKGGTIPLHKLVKNIQYIVPDMGARDVAALMVAVDPTNCGQVEYSQFVRAQEEFMPGHTKLLKAGIKGGETHFEKWGVSPITKQTPPMRFGAQFPSSRSDTNLPPAPPYSRPAPSQRAAYEAVGNRWSFKPAEITGTGEDFEYTEGNVFDEEGEVDERALVRSVTLSPLLGSLAATHRAAKSRQGSRNRFAYLSSSMPEMSRDRTEQAKAEQGADVQASAEASTPTKLLETNSSAPLTPTCAQPTQLGSDGVGEGVDLEGQNRQGEAVAATADAAGEAGSRSATPMKGSRRGSSSGGGFRKAVNREAPVFWEGYTGRFTDAGMEGDSWGGCAPNRGLSTGNGRLEGTRAWSSWDASATPGACGLHALLMDKGNTKFRGSERFKHLCYPDTRHVMHPEPGCSQYQEPAACFFKKEDPGYAVYQTEDKEKKAAAAQNQLMVADESAKLVQGRRAKDMDAAESRDAANLGAFAWQKQRYRDRMQYIHQVRSGHDGKDTNYTRHLGIHFGNGFGSHFSGEHLATATFFNRE